MEKRNFIQRAWDKFMPSDSKPEERGIYYGPTNNLGLPYNTAVPTMSMSYALQLSAIYRCVEVISDAIACQTLEVNKHTDNNGWVNDEFDQVAYLLNIEPSPTMSHYTLMKVIIAKMLLDGNAYVRIHRNGTGDPKRLELINDTVKVFKRENDTMFYEVGKPGGEYLVEGEDMLHIMNFTYDGLIGVSTLRHAANTMGLAYSSEQSAKGFFSSGANMSGILTTEGKLTPEKASAIKASWSSAFDVTTGNPGGIAVMEDGLKFHPVTVNPKDAQMLETRKFNVIEICRFFGVSPAKVFDDSNLTYSNIESFQLSFITDTISPLNSKIEAELNRKLLRPSKRMKTRIKLNITDLIKANLDTKANYMSKMFQCGAFTVNEIRKEVGMPKKEGGDEAYVQVNMQPINRKPEVKGKKTIEDGE